MPNLVCSQIYFWTILSTLPEFSDEWHNTALALFPLLHVDFSSDKLQGQEGEICDALIERLTKFKPDGWSAFIDEFKDGILTGWAKEDGSDNSCWISLGVNGKIAYETFLANLMRSDVKKAGFGTGKYGFKVRIPMADLHKSWACIDLFDGLKGHLISFKFFRI